MALRGLLKNCERIVLSLSLAEKNLPLNFLYSVPHLNFVSSSKPNPSKNEYEVTFIKSSGEKIKGKGKQGDSLLDVIVNNDLDFDGYGACEGTLTCSTCHVVLKKEDYDRLPDKPSEEENDMLDLAYGLTDTSRLGCQIYLCKELHGLEVKLPETINDARS